LVISVPVVEITVWLLRNRAAAPSSPRELEETGPTGQSRNTGAARKASRSTPRAHLVHAEKRHIGFMSGQCTRARPARAGDDRGAHRGDANGIREQDLASSVEARAAPRTTPAPPPRRPPAGSSARTSRRTAPATLAGTLGEGEQPETSRRPPLRPAAARARRREP
jgi:hypothetical protein